MAEMKCQHTLVTVAETQQRDTAPPTFTQAIPAPREPSHPRVSCQHRRRLPAPVSLHRLKRSAPAGHPDRQTHAPRVPRVALDQPRGASTTRAWAHSAGRFQPATRHSTSANSATGSTTRLSGTDRQHTGCLTLHQVLLSLIM